MTNDSIIDEIRRNRGEYAERFNYDIRAMVEDAKRRQLMGDRQVVHLPPRPAQLQTTVKYRN
jgi:hypothetical protein